MEAIPPADSDCEKHRRLHEKLGADYPNREDIHSLTYLLQMNFESAPGSLEGTLAFISVTGGRWSKERAYLGRNEASSRLAGAAHSPLCMGRNR
ncbi:hypothetical protein TNCV_2534791 [Trichonephila clavipes]|nr:hypothetical protein TNCV_2534791 [Trichonephila clavipes]